MLHGLSVFRQRIANSSSTISHSTISGIVVHFGEIYTPGISQAAAGVGNTKVADPVNFREIFLRGEQMKCTD